MVFRATYPASASAWQLHQATITQLYRDEDRTLEQVMLIMAEEHGFKATEKMYKSRIKMWRLDKKNKLHEVKEILRQRARRRSIGKKTAVLRGGRLVDMADVDRYGARKGLKLYPEASSPDGSAVFQDLVFFTPPATPLPLDAPDSQQNTEHFLHAFDVFIKDSLKSGLWTLGKDVMGFACVLGIEYAGSARDRFFLSVERGVRRYNLGDISQAYRQWRVAFDELQFVVQSRRPSQLLCLVELVAHLAECKDEVANLLLRYLGDLVNKHGYHDARMAMLRSLSRLQAEDLTGLTAVSHDCSRHAFSGHFRRQSFFLLDSETILMDSNNESEEAGVSQLEDLMLGWETYDAEALRAARSVMEILMTSERYKEAELIATIHIQRMHEMQYDGTVGGAFSHAYSYLTHLYLMTRDYEKAYQCTLLKVENYFHVLEYRVDLPEDFILSSYSLLSSLAQRLGLDEEADKWKREHTILKKRTDALAANELSDLRSRAQPNLQITRTSASLSHIPETIPDLPVEDFRKCNCHTLAQPEPEPEPQIGGNQPRNAPRTYSPSATTEVSDDDTELTTRSTPSPAKEQPHPDMFLTYTQKRPSWRGEPMSDANEDEKPVASGLPRSWRLFDENFTSGALPIVQSWSDDDDEQTSPYAHNKSLEFAWSRWRSLPNVGQEAPLV